MVDSNTARTSLHHTLHLRAALPVFLVLLALPVLLLLALGFAAPLVTVTSYSFAIPRSFDVFPS